MCHKRKRLASFHACTASPDEHQYACKRCRKVYDANRRMQKPSGITAALRRWLGVTMESTQQGEASGT